MMLTGRQIREGRILLGLAPSTLERLGVEFSPEEVGLRTLEADSATAAGPREADPA